jgi:hypothetical protein
MPDDDHFPKGTPTPGRELSAQLCRCEAGAAQLITTGYACLPLEQALHVVVHAANVAQKSAPSRLSTARISAATRTASCPAAPTPGAPARAVTSSGCPSDRKW